MRILIADDLPVIRLIIKRALAQYGVDEIDEARDGEEAWQKIQEREYHIIILDWNMPKMEGIEVAYLARERGVKCPIIMQTTKAREGNVREAVQVGITDYFVKPFNTAYCFDKLEKHIINAAMKGA